MPPHTPHTHISVIVAPYRDIRRDERWLHIIGDNFVKRGEPLCFPASSFITGPAVGLETIITTKLCLVADLQHHTLINSWLIIKTPPPKVMVTFPVSGPTVKSSSCCAPRSDLGTEIPLHWSTAAPGLFYPDQWHIQGSAAGTHLLRFHASCRGFHVGGGDYYLHAKNMPCSPTGRCFSSRQRGSLDDGADVFEPERPSMNAL